MRGELKRLSVSLRQHAAAIAEALEELDAGGGEPVGPSDPVDPLDPLDPVDPLDPLDPRDPVGPVDPVDPHEPAATTRADARLVALDMALGGSSREEIDRELAARFDLADRAAVIDEVLAAIA
jgi:hypothetical protein